MPTQVRCPSCGKTYLLAAPPSGPSVRFTECGHTVRMGYIGRYQILEEIGRGAFGVVYRVFDPKMDREAAIKVLHAEVAQQAGSAETLRRFQNEAKLLAQIVHPNILPLYEADQHEGRLYLVMALIRGRCLDELIPPEGFPDPRRAVALTLPLLEALHYVHSAYGICHRDVKPANIMVGDGDSMFLMDFGLAVCQAQDATRSTSTGAVLGTPAYMPPEQAEGNRAKIGPWSDQYSVGIILFHLLTGQLPFRKPLPAILTDIISTPPPAPSTLRPDLGPEIDRIVLKALEKDPQNRYRDCHEFAEVLRDWSGRYTAAVITGDQRLTGSELTRGVRGSSKVWAAVVGALLTAGLLGTGGYLLLRGGPSKSGKGAAAPPSSRKGEKSTWQGD